MSCGRMVAKEKAPQEALTRRIEDVEVGAVAEVRAKAPVCIPDFVVRTVSENAKTPKLQAFEFEEESRFPAQRSDGGEAAATTRSSFPVLAHLLAKRGSSCPTCAIFTNS